MGRFRRYAIAVLLLSLGPSAPASARDDRRERLSPQHLKWLEEEVTWVITRPEREEFLDARDGESRNRFIERFWQMRDPQPLTAVNEFKEEHYKRLEYANRNLATETSRRGWQTDRGRVYILLGPPNDIERVVSANEVYPYEMWFYGHKTAPGLPGALRLVFYRANGMGEFRLLNPVLDKARMFPPSTQIDVDDIHQLQQLLGPEVRQALEGVSPGYGLNASDEIIAELRSPKQIPERIRDRGQALNPRVRTRWTVQPIELAIISAVEPLADGSSRVHLSTELPPEEIAFTEISKDRFLARIDVFGDIKDAAGLVVAQFDEAITLDLQREEVERRKRNAFVFQAQRTLVPGRYEVSVFLQDFTRARLGRAVRDVVVPQPSTGVRIEPLLVASRLEPATGGDSKPFSIVGLQSLVRTGSRFGIDDTLFLFGVVRNLPAKPTYDLAMSIRRGNQTIVTHQAQLSTPGPVRTIAASLPTAGIAAGPCEVLVEVRRDGELLIGDSVPFTIVANSVDKGAFLYTENRRSLPEIDHYNRGLQLLSGGQPAEAEKHFRIALSHRETFRPAQIYLARCLLIAGKSADAETLIDKVLKSAPDDYEALVTKATVLLQRGEFVGAGTRFEAAMANGPRTKELLNGLAEAAVGQGDSAGARRWFTESLTLDPDQPVVQRRLKSLGG